MNERERAEFTLPTRLARRRLLVGRLALGVVCANALLALAAAYLLSGPMAWATIFRLGFLGWAGVLFPASLMLAVPVMAPLVIRLLKPPAEEAPGERR